MTPLAVVRGF